MAKLLDGSGVESRLLQPGLYSSKNSHTDLVPSPLHLILLRGTLVFSVCTLPVSPHAQNSTSFCSGRVPAQVWRAEEHKQADSSPITAVGWLGW